MKNEKIKKRNTKVGKDDSEHYLNLFVPTLDPSHFYVKVPYMSNIKDLLDEQNAIRNKKNLIRSDNL